jgi:hypothetical protein
MGTQKDKPKGPLSSPQETLKVKKRKGCAKPAFTLKDQHKEQEESVLWAKANLHWGREEKDLVWRKALRTTKARQHPRLDPSLLQIKMVHPARSQPLFYIMI